MMGFYFGYTGWRMLLVLVFLLLLGVSGGEAQNLGGNILTDGDFGVLPVGENITIDNYRQSFSIQGVANERESFEGVSYLSSGRFSDNKSDNKYVIGGKVNAFGYSDWWKDIRDNRTPNGLMLIVEAAAGGATTSFYRREVAGLNEGMWYSFSAKAINAFQKDKANGLFIPVKMYDTQVLVDANDEEEKGNSGQLKFNSSEWNSIRFDVTPSDGRIVLLFKVKRYYVGGAAEERVGNDVAVDDIELKPYLLTPGVVTMDGCGALSSGRVVLNGTVSGGPSGKETKYGRWMKREKGTEVWRWASGDVQDQGYTLVCDTADYRRHEYRVIYSFSRNLLFYRESPFTEFSDDYAFSEVHTGGVFPRLQVVDVSLKTGCKSGTDWNSGSVGVVCPSGVQQFTWQVGAGIPQTTVCPGGGGVVTVDFDYKGADQFFTVLSYSVPEFCKLSFTEPANQLSLVYVPNIGADEIDVSGVSCCVGETGVVLKAEVVSKLIKNARYYWYDGSDLSGERLAEGMSYAFPGSSEVGEHVYYVAVEADNRCLSLPEGGKKAVVLVNPTSLGDEIRVTGSRTVCEGVALSLTASAAEGVLSPVFEWYCTDDFAGGGLLESGAVLTTDTLGAGEHRVYVRMRGDNRCFNLSADAQVVDVMVVGRATATDVTVSGGGSVCREDVIALEATAVAGVGEVRFFWFTDAALTSALTEGLSGVGNSVLTVSGAAVGEHIYYVALEGDHLCLNGAGTAGEAVFTVMDSFPFPQVLPDTVRVFVGEDAELSFSAVGATDAVYEWYRGAELLGGGSSVIVRGLSEGVHLFRVRVRDGRHCWGRWVEVAVRVYPETNIRLEDVTVCAGDGGKLTVKTALSDLRFVWSDREDFATTLAGGQTLDVSAALAPGVYVYYVRVTDNAGLTVSLNATVTVKSRAVITIGEGRAVVCVGTDLKVPFTGLVDAQHYKVTLKGSSIEGYSFPDYTGVVTAEMVSGGELPVLGYTILPEMGGGDFVFCVEVWGELFMNGKLTTYCGTVADYAIFVQLEGAVTVDEPSLVCAGGSVDLSAVVELSGHEVLGYRWLSEDGLLGRGEGLTLSGLTKEMNRKQVWLEVETGCGMVVSNRVSLQVYDDRFNVISYSGGDVYSGMMVEVEGAVVPVSGVVYTWEQRLFFSDHWEPMVAKTTASIYANVLVSSVFRRTVAVGSCGSVSNEVGVNVADYTDTTGTEEGVGRFVFQETFGVVPEYGEWAKENGDKYNLNSFRKYDHTGGINTSKYGLQGYTVKANGEEKSVNDSDRLPEEDPLRFYAGGWGFVESTTNKITEPWTKYKNNAGYVWCNDGMLIYNNRTGYVENGVYCSGNGTATRPARWFNINGSWKMGCWERKYYTGSSSGMGDGMYALTPCPNGLDAGGLLAPWQAGPDHTVDPAGRTGLMLVVNAKDKEAAYSRTVGGLTGGMWYRLEASVANAERYASANANGRPNLKFEVTGNGVVGVSGLQHPSVTSGELAQSSGELTWTRCTLCFYVPEGENEVRFSVSNTTGGGSGNVFVVDDIAVRELLVKGWDVRVDFCSQPGMMKFTGMNEVVLPEYAKVYSRVMQQKKGGNLWEWAGGLSDSMKVVIPAERVIGYEFKTVMAFSSLLLDKMDPNDLSSVNKLGYYAVTDQYATDEFCLLLNGYHVDYVTVRDSVSILPDFFGKPEGCGVYSRIGFRRFGSEEWGWYGSAGLSDRSVVAWIDFLEGDFRVVYAFSPELLNGLSGDGIVSRTRYYVATDVISGVKPEFTVTERFENGSVFLKPEIEGLPMGASPAGCWMKRKRGSGEWLWLPMEENLSLSRSLFVYSDEEYRFVYSQSKGLIDTLRTQYVSETGRGYRVSEIFSGRGYEFGDITTDFCAEPGKAVNSICFSSVYPEGVEVHGRWMERERGATTWRWMSNVVYGLPKFSVEMDDYLAHEYRFVLAWSRDSLLAWEADGLPAVNDWYRLREEFSVAPFCLSVDTIRVVSVGRGRFELRPEVVNVGESVDFYGRWMRCVAGSGDWEWCGESAKKGVTAESVSSAELSGYDFRFCVVFQASLLEEVRVSEVSYLAARTFFGSRVYCPEVRVGELFCVENEDVNRVVFGFDKPEAVASFTYCIGNGGAQTVTDGAMAEFMLTGDTLVHLLYYSQSGLCDSIVWDDTLRVEYRPRPGIGKMTDVFGCMNQEVVLAPEVSVAEGRRLEWFRGDDPVSFSGGDTLRVSMTRPDTVLFTLRVSGEGFCPALKSVSVIAAEYPEMEYNAGEQEVCTGELFFMDYAHTTADRYRLTLKETTMPGFTFYAGTGAVLEKENGRLEVVSGQIPLYATDFMAGHTFTFRVQLYRSVEFNGVVYRCENEFEQRFKVRARPLSVSESVLSLCSGSEVVLAPVVEGNGNRIDGYVWRLWDGDSLRVDRELVRGAESALSATVTDEWVGKRLQLAVLCECGEVVVQDVSLSIFSDTLNRITVPAGLVFTGESGRIGGTEIPLPGLGYQWECRGDGVEWTVLKGKNAVDLEEEWPDSAMVYRRRVVSDVYSCAAMVSNEVTPDVYNPGRENRIFTVVAADSLVAAGSVVEIVSGGVVRDSVRTMWQKNEDGNWTNLEEIGLRLTLTVTDLTMVRRVAEARGRTIYSNVLILSVYDAEKNTISAPVSLVKPGEVVRMIGSYMAVEGVRYQWYSRPVSEETDVRGDEGGGWEVVPGAMGCNLEMNLRGSAFFVRYVYLPSLSGDSLRSNEVFVCLFDNAKDNRIACALPNVCRGDTVRVSGVKIGVFGDIYRWECSLDGGSEWEVLPDFEGVDFQYAVEKSCLLRRRVLTEGAGSDYSNVLFLNVMHGDDDNVITLKTAVVAGQPTRIDGSVVQSAIYCWERSEDGVTWRVLEGKQGCNLDLSGQQTQKECYFRRRVSFAEAGACESVSEVLKMAVMNEQESNVIQAPEGRVCQWAEFTVVGKDMDELGAKYRWYCQLGTHWEVFEYSFGKDLVVHEGIGANTIFRRDATVNGVVYMSNVVEVSVWQNEVVENVLESPGVICSGAEIRIKGSDVVGKNTSGLVKGYCWEESLTGGGSTWVRLEGADSCHLQLAGAEESRWYCRVVTTHCGNELRSQPVFQEVKERLPLTLRNDVPFGVLGAKTPVTISVDEDTFSSYVFSLNGTVKESEGQMCRLYGWTPKKEYLVVVNVQTPSGCVQTDTMRLRTPDVDLPNVFTPNDDSFNDVLLAGYDLQVFNRWGNLLYAGVTGWDGRYKGELVSAATYFYVVKILQDNGVITEYKRSVALKR